MLVGYKLYQLCSRVEHDRTGFVDGDRIETRLWAYFGSCLTPDLNSVGQKSLYHLEGRYTYYYYYYYYQA